MNESVDERGRPPPIIQVVTYLRPLVRSARGTTIGGVSDNRRSTTRHDVDLPCAVEDGEAREARVVNLSVGGALIEYPRRPMGHRVALRLDGASVSDRKSVV